MGTFGVAFVSFGAALIVTLLLGVVLPLWIAVPVGVIVGYWRRYGGSGMTPPQILRDARALVATPERWTPTWEARDALGDAVGFDSPRATRYDVIGALFKAVGMNVADVPPYGEDMRLALAAYRAAITGHYNALSEGYDAIDFIARWQEWTPTTHDDVLTKFDVAIAVAEHEADKHERRVETHLLRMQRDAVA